VASTMSTQSKDANGSPSASKTDSDSWNHQAPRRGTRDLPWSFVLKDRTWNLVIACRNCNSEKRDKLTNMAAIERLCARNEEITKDPKWMEHRFGRHFVEWHSRDLSSHIKGLYDQAIADKFPMWN
jgi:hypothetical protein